MIDKKKWKKLLIFCSHIFLNITFPGEQKGEAVFGSGSVFGAGAGGAVFGSAGGGMFGGGQSQGFSFASLAQASGQTAFSSGENLP